MKTGLSFGILSLFFVFSSIAAAQTRPANPSPETRPETKPSAPAAVENEKAAKTALEMRVVGVLAIGDGTDRRSSAIISTKGSKTSQTYSPGQTLDGNADVRLVRVQNERIEFMNQGRLEFAPVRRFPEAGWGGNAPVATSSPAPSSSSSSSSYGSQPSAEATDRLQALKDARKERLQKRSQGGTPGAEKPAE